jgi:antitoxin component YwqK of YwqJK toxin-antitoxin module
LIETALESIENFLEENTLPNKPNPKLEKLALYWMANGNIILPEDGYKVLEAIRIADAKKIDPFTFKNPTELINKYQAEVKGKKITIDEIDKMPEFTNKTKAAREFGMNDFTDNIIFYTVEDTKEGQAAVRKIIDSHFGEDANPWCLAARVDGNLDDAWFYWSNRYNAYPKKIAFKNGKLVAFSANSDSDVLWWDRNDEARGGIEVTKDIGDNKKQTVFVNENAETVEFGTITRETTTKDQQGNKIGIVETFNEIGEVKLLNRTKNGKLDGDQIEYFRSTGNMFISESFKDGLRDGPTTTYSADGRVVRDEYFKNGKQDGNQERFYRSGEIQSQEYYKNGEPDGIQRYYYENGQLKYEINIIDGKAEGLEKEYHENGQIAIEKNWKKRQKRRIRKNIWF